MGFVEKVKNVISKLRAAGKTEKEVSEIIEQAAEAATVLKKTESPEHGLLEQYRHIRHVPAKGQALCEC